MSYLQAVRRIHRDAWKMMLVPILIGFCYGGIYAVVFNLYLLRLGYRVEFVGLLTGTALLISALCGIPAGMVGRRWGLRRGVLVGYLMWVAASVLLPLAELLPLHFRSAWLLIIWSAGWVGVGLYGVNRPALSDRPIPTWPWLLKNVGASRIGNSKWPEFAMHYPQLCRTSPLVQRGWNDELFAGFERIRQEREHFLHVQECLPQTLVHDDAGRKNLIARRRPNGDFETVVIDWGSAAIGSIGHDLAILVTQPVFWHFDVRPQDLKELDPLAFDAYVQGLRDMGWHGDSALVRLGYTLGVVIRIGLGIMIFEWAARDEKTCLFVESAIGHPIEEIAETMRGLRGYIIACADEARQLMASQDFLLSAQRHDG